jgi:CheY-like chemotaxis protein
VDILVIDDSADRLRWFQDVLEAAGHNVRLADTAEAALDQVRETQFDLAFFDHDLGPGMNGSQLANQIFNSRRKTKAPKAIWIHTSNPVGVNNIKAKCLSAGIPTGVGSFETFAKNPKGLLEAIARLVAQASP